MLQISIISTLIYASTAHIPVNGSDFIIFGEHSDLHHEFIETTREPITTTETTSITTTSSDSDIEQFVDPNRDSVVFIRTESPVYRNEDSFHADSMKLSDIMENNKKISNVAQEADSQNNGVMFIAGKNGETEDVKAKHVDKHTDARRNMNSKANEKKIKPVVLNCTNLDCNNYKVPVCGVKLERYEKKYRIFANECFFRKVNCGFVHEVNRYTEVDLSFCKGYDGFSRRRPTDDDPFYAPYFSRQASVEKKAENVEARRSSGRRAMTINQAEKLCDHMCPMACTDNFEPECAISVYGKRKVFTNHCHLDMNSCQFEITWQRLPLAECVGERRADMQQNRAFIGWMQQVGLLDRKGKLVLQK